MTHFPNFRETLGRHLLAIETRDLDTLTETLGDTPILITGDAAKPLEIYESAALGIAVLHVDYREGGGSRESFRTLVFEQREGEWRLVQDQDTATR